MWHPWRTLRDDYSDWQLYVTPLPADIEAGSNATRRLIWLDSSLSQVERRCALTHELIHAERGDTGPCDDRTERVINAEAARRLIEIHALARAVVWARDLYELAAELWVTPEMVLHRREHLHPAERAIVSAALAARDGNVRPTRQGAVHGR